jgi:ribosomal protein S8
MEMIHGIKNISKEGVRRYEARRFKTPESAERSADPLI